MRAIMMMFDTLTRNYLPNYGCDFTKMPNFERLEQHGVTFDEFYGGSMPCMPARRELHTGKYNFLNRGWGPLEPFDESAIAILSKNGIYTHLVTDHTHYFEDGGATYHNRYDSYEFFRGQEGDRWVPRAEAEPAFNTCSLNKSNISATQHLANRTRIRTEEEMPSVQCVSAGLDFMEHYHDKDDWFLQVECFDPHEPFFVPDKYRALYDCGDSHEAFNFPAYGPVENRYTEEDVRNLRKEYCALLSMCDAQLGRLLDKMDEYDMWKDTLLIVNTDHGFFLGEHDFIGKNFPPMYDEVIHTPFFIHDPRMLQAQGRRQSVAQTVDIAPTLLAYYGLHFETQTDGTDLSCVVKADAKIHDTILFGVHGSQINIYDGRYCYMKSAVDSNLPVYHETLMPTNMRGFVGSDGIDRAQLIDGGRYANRHKVLRIPLDFAPHGRLRLPTMVFDKKEDPGQQHPLKDEALIRAMDEKLQKAMEAADAPKWQFERMGFAREKGGSL